MNQKEALTEEDEAATWSTTPPPPDCVAPWSPPPLIHLRGVESHRSLATMCREVCQQCLCGHSGAKWSQFEVKMVKSCSSVRKHHSVSLDFAIYSITAFIFIQLQAMVMHNLLPETLNIAKFHRKLSEKDQRDHLTRKVWKLQKMLLLASWHPRWIGIFS